MPDAWVCGEKACSTRRWARDGKFANATHLDPDAGLVSYQVGACASAERRSLLAFEYNERKEELERDEAPAGLEALLWWNEYRGLATLRISPWLFNMYRGRISSVLQSCGSVEQLWQLKNQDCGWQLKLTNYCSFPGFRDALASFLAGFIADNLKMLTTRAVLGGAQESDRKDESLMKKMFPVLVCERKAKKEGGAKEDGEFLKGFAPKFVPAVAIDVARTKVIAELIASKQYGDPDDPDVSIAVCNPFGGTR